LNRTNELIQIVINQVSYTLDITDL
jgi:hypothetical protein